MADHYEVVYNLLNSAIFSDLEWPLTKIFPETAQDRNTVTVEY